MKTTLFFRAPMFLFLLFSGLFSAVAAGITTVSPGEEVVIRPDFTMENPVSFEWAIFQDGSQKEVLSEEVFLHRFLEEGEYDVVFSVRNEEGKTESSTMRVIVRSNPNELLPFDAALRTLPPTDEEGIIHVSKDNPSFWMIAKESSGEIAEYRFDKNLVVDSDGDGTPSNDQDNPDPSKSTWVVAYQQGVLGDIPVRFSAVNATGEVSTQTRTVRVEDLSLLEQPIEAVMFSYPPADKSGVIHLSGDSSEVYFLPSLSKGNIVQYRIDENTAIDSDGNGNPADDIDNRRDTSFYRGTPFSLIFQKSDAEERILQFVVVSEEGKGSLLRRKIVFDGAFHKEETISEMNPKLILDHPSPFVGEEVTFTVLGTSPGVIFSWDFNGDGASDKSGENSSEKHIFSTEGEFTVGVTVSSGDTSILLHESLTVLPIPKEDAMQTTAPPIANFSFENVENGTSFTNLSRADTRLEDPSLAFLWDFGDEQTSTDPSPLHQYAKTGTFSVSLTVTDTTKQSSQKTASVVVDTATEQAPTPTVGILTITKGQGFEGEVASVPSGISCGETCSAPFPLGTAVSLSSDREDIAWSEGCKGGSIAIAEDTVCTIDISQKALSSNTPSDEKKSSFLLPFFILLGTFLLLLPGILLVIRKIQSPDESFGEILEEMLPGRKRPGIAPFQKQNPETVPIANAPSIFQAVAVPPPSDVAPAVSTPAEFPEETDSSDYSEEVSDARGVISETPVWISPTSPVIPDDVDGQEEALSPEILVSTPEEKNEQPETEVSTTPTSLPEWLHNEEKEVGEENLIGESGDIPSENSQEQEEENAPQSPLGWLQAVSEPEEHQDPLLQKKPGETSFTSEWTDEDTPSSPLGSQQEPVGTLGEPPLESVVDRQESKQKSDTTVPEWLKDDYLDSPTSPLPTESSEKKMPAIPTVPPFVPPSDVSAPSNTSSSFDSLEHSKEVSSAEEKTVSEKELPPPHLPPSIPETSFSQKTSAPTQASPLPENRIGTSEDLLFGEANLPPMPSQENKGK